MQHFVQPGSVILPAIVGGWVVLAFVGEFHEGVKYLRCFVGYFLNSEDNVLLAVIVPKSRP